ncbi:MAG: hypothetical protein DMG73_04995 [Acidobacteria bacterium]|nr:MAG: hypothetical protein DMG73_04995 [Acidobacteriota bacterium]PYX62885.1 MAG: hypothetical protein DMG74_19070 [Acidobacteriota bacterium]
MKWFYLTCFAAGVLATLLWSALVTFGIVIRHDVRVVALLAPLLFLFFLTREVFSYFQEERRRKAQEKSN